MDSSPSGELAPVAVSQPRPRRAGLEASGVALSVPIPRALSRRHLHSRSHRREEDPPYVFGLPPPYRFGRQSRRRSSTSIDDMPDSPDNPRSLRRGSHEGPTDPSGGYTRHIEGMLQASTPRRSQRLAPSASRDSSSSSPQAARNSSSETSPPASRKRKAPPPSSTTRRHIRPAVRRKKPPPVVAKEETEEVDRKPAAVETENVSCCICMCEPEKEEKAKINGCEHLFCFDCIGKWADRENTCPLCKARFTTISRVHKIKRSKGDKRSLRNSKKVKPRDQRADIISGPAIEAMLASLAAAGAGGRNGPTHISRFFLALGGARTSSRANAASARAARGLFDGDDMLSDMFEDDDSDLHMIHFGRLMRQSVAAAGRRGGSTTLSFAVPIRHEVGPRRAFGGLPFSPSEPPTRTFASNSNDQDAGTSANPLSIDLDDDDDDSSVEILPALM